MRPAACRGALLSLAACLLFGAAARAAELRVEPREPEALVRALQQAQDGDLIRIATGTYAGPLVIDRRVTLVGEGLPVIDGRWADGNAVTVTASGAALEGLWVRNGGTRLPADDSGVKVVGASGVRLTGVRVTGSLHGIYLDRADGAVLSGNRIEGRPDLRMEDRGNGIQLFHTRGARLEGNEIRSTRDGIYFSFSDEVQVTGNHITGVRYGLHYMYSNANRFRANRFEENVAGAAIMFSKAIELRENLFRRHRGQRAYGLLLKGSSEVLVESNRFLDNTRAIFLDDTQRSRIFGNQITGNDVGVLLNASSVENAFAGNTFAGNLEHVRPDAARPSNRFACAEGGNYWDDYAFVDLDGDGVGDRPHQVGQWFGYMTGRFPAVQLLTASPAFDVIRLLERAFPLFSYPKVVDPAPLMRPPSPGTGGQAAAGDVGDGARSAGNRVRLLTLSALWTILGLGIFRKGASIGWVRARVLRRSA